MVDERLGDRDPSSTISTPSIEGCWCNCNTELASGLIELAVALLCLTASLSRAETDLLPTDIAGTWHAAEMTNEFVPPQTMLPGTLRRLKSAREIHNTQVMTNRARVADPDTFTEIKEPSETPKSAVID